MKKRYHGHILLFFYSISSLFFWVPQTVKAQSPCYLQGADGQQIDLGSLCGEGSSVTSPAPTESHYSIPIKRRMNGIPTVEVLINGEHQIEMLFDTGASVVVLDQNMANKLGISTGAPVGFAQTAGGGRFRSQRLDLSH